MSELPFSYFSPESGGYVVWMCDYDADRKITSVFYDKKSNERQVKYVSLEDAIIIRDELVKGGWQIAKPPKVTVNFSGKK
ncbi:MAG TPA: hypothetical protein VLE02_00895 [Nitrosarchaeum sp.]|nr:hypothetical protein [Nitrosarchaeum sp.]